MLMTFIERDGVKMALQFAKFSIIPAGCYAILLPSLFYQKRIWEPVFGNEFG